MFNSVQRLDVEELMLALCKQFLNLICQFSNSQIKNFLNSVINVWWCQRGSMQRILLMYLNSVAHSGFLLPLSLSFPSTLFHGDRIKC